MKKLFLLLILTLVSTGAFAQLRLDENFDYPAGDSIGAHGWVANTGGSLNRILVTTPGLTYAGYPLSGIGNAATLANTGQDAYKLLSNNDSSGSVYCSFMVKIDTARTGDYFLALLQTGSNSFYEGRVQVRTAGAGLVNFGITKANSSSDLLVPGIWSTTTYSLGTTYLVVLKYTFVPGGTTNDQVSLYVFSSGLPATEPATPTVGPITYSSNDATSIGRVALRQGTAASAPNLVVDGIRVATSWFSTAVNIRLAIQGPTTAGFTGKDSVKIYLHNPASPFAVVDSAVANTEINGTVFTNYEFKNAAPGSYYLDVRYRNQPVFRNGIETWSAAPITIAQYNGGSYDFTTAASKAFGDNQILIGSVYAIYNGDINQDGIVDGSDGAAIDNAAANFQAGYLNTDLDANDFVDGSDGAIADNNASNFVAKITP
ncbi:MAG: hypothetical protein ABIY50_09615 [Ignavibacteria bacterium]